jgi:hypothetical protein
MVGAESHAAIGDRMRRAQPDDEAEALPVARRLRPIAAILAALPLSGSPGLVVLLRPDVNCVIMPAT